MTKSHSNKERVIKRIVKLLRIADDVSSPEEALIAAKQARALMDKYQLKKADIKEISAFAKVDIKKPQKRYPLWKSELSVSVAKWNDCHTKWDVNDDGSKTDVFMGFEVDAFIAASMYEYLVNTVERLCNQRRIVGKKAKNHFKMGASHALQKRIHSLIQERKTHHETSGRKDLVMSKLAMVEAHFGVVEYDANREFAADEKELSCYYDGVLAGNKINLSDQVKNNTSDKIAISETP